MNFLNRLLVTLITLIALAVAALGAAAPFEMLGIVGALVSNLTSYADRLLPAGRILVALIGLSVDLMLLFWLWLEIRRPNQRTVRVQRTDGAEAEVTTETLTERLEYAVDSLADVLKAKARVRSYGRNVEVKIEAEIKPGIAVAVKAAEIAAAVREVGEVTMGLALRGKPKILIRAIRFPKEAFAEPEEAPPLPALRSGEETTETASDSGEAATAKKIQPE
jgi:hypothetical protein